MLARLTAVTACAVVALTTLGSTAEAATAVPRNLTGTSATATTVHLRWSGVSGAAAYRVQLSSSSTMANATYHRFAGTTGILRTLAPRTRYFFRVSALDAAGHRVSGYTGRTYPSASTTPVATPTGLRLGGAAGDSTVPVAWTAAEGARLYRIVRASSPTFVGATYARSTSASSVLTGLSAGQTYYVRVKVINRDGTSVTPYTAPLAVTTSTPVPPTSTPVPPTSTGSGPADVQVGSFNVSSVSLDSATGALLPWAQRRSAVVADILGEHLDVVGVQEVNPSHYWASRLVDGYNQYLDLQNGLNEAGGTYRVTNAAAFNCVDPTASYNCVYQARGASNGDRILYNTSTLQLISQGAFQFATQNPGKNVQYLPYAVLRVKATGQSFLFTTTHLDPTDVTIRTAQWHELVQETNRLKGDLPVVSTGDFNTHKMSPLAASMLPAMKAAGYGDVLNQEYLANPTPHPRALHTVNGWLNSFNHLDRNVADWSYESQRYESGQNIDWVFATNSLVVKEWKVVADFDPTTLMVRGVWPSDHNMVRATLTLP